MILVALTDDSTFALFKVGGSPRYVDMVQGAGAVLDVAARSHLLGAPDDDGHVAPIAGGEQRLEFRGLASFVNEADLLSRHPPADQLVLDRGVDGELFGVLGGCSPVAEHDLQRAALCERAPGVGVGVDAVGVDGVDAHDLIGDRSGS